MKKHKRKELGFGALLMIGSGISVLSVIFAAFISAFISLMTKDPTSYIGALSLASLLLGGMISAIITSIFCDENGAHIGIISSVICAALMLIAGLIMSRGALPFMVFINMFAFIAVSSLSSVLSIKYRRNSSKRKHTYR